MKNEEANRIKPIVLTDTETGEQYTLEFTADSVTYAQQRGFNLNEWEAKPMVVFPQLFMYSFRANHRSVMPYKIQKLWDELSRDGVPDGVLERLMELYNKPIACMLVGEDEDGGKNSKVTVEL